MGLLAQWNLPPNITRQGYAVGQERVSKTFPSTTHQHIPGSWFIPHSTIHSSGDTVANLIEHYIRAAPGCFLEFQPLALRFTLKPPFPTNVTKCSRGIECDSGRGQRPATV